jgi:hypothetical protein
VAMVSSSLRCSCMNDYILRFLPPRRTRGMPWSLWPAASPFRPALREACRASGAALEADLDAQVASATLSSTSVPGVIILN